MSRPIQLHEMIPVETPLGPGVAVIFQAQEHDNSWTVMLESGAFVTFPQAEVRAARSYYPRVKLTQAEMMEIIRANRPTKE